MKKQDKEEILIKFVTRFTWCLLWCVVALLIILMCGVGHDLKYATDCTKDFLRIVTPAIMVIPSSIFTYFLGKQSKANQSEATTQQFSVEKQEDGCIDCK